MQIINLELSMAPGVHWVEKYGKPSLEEMVTRNAALDVLLTNPAIANSLTVIRRDYHRIVLISQTHFSDATLRKLANLLAQDCISVYESQTGNGRLVGEFAEEFAPDGFDKASFDFGGDTFLPTDK